MIEAIGLHIYCSILIFLILIIEAVGVHALKLGIGHGLLSLIKQNIKALSVNRIY